VARGISSVTGVPVEQALKRTRFAGSQTRLRAEERQSNVEGAFRLRRAEAVRGRHVLLVDDVVTTGATMLACGHELLRAEGVKISILSLGLTR
jgi:predicted amidophosphoribosyltransferase